MTKAISAVITTIMLLMITVSLIGVFYVFSSTLATQTTSSGSTQASQFMGQLSMCMQVDNIYKNQVTLRNCGKGMIENKSLIVMMDDIKLGASTQTILEGNSSVVNITGLWQIPFGKHSLKISNGAAVAQNLVDVQPNKDGLVGSWNFNEGSGTKANDGSGNNNIGTLLPAGSEPVWTSGKFNKGLQFDGTNDYVNIIDAASLDITTQITIEAYISIPDYKYHQAIVTKGSDGISWGYLLQFDYNVAPYGRLGFYTDQTSWDYTSSSIPKNAWTHVAVTYDGSYKKFYINGVLDTSIADTGNIYANSAPLRIGARSDGFYFNGTIDEVRVWSRALAPDETVVMKQII